MISNEKNISGQKDFNWEAAHQRIADVMGTLAGNGEASPAVLERIWAQRAAQLAKMAVTEARGEQIQLTLVRMRDEVYGLDVGHITTIRRGRQITPVPRLPAWVRGVVNIRGEIHSVIDLHRFFGLPDIEGKPESSEVSTYLVVVETPGMKLALQVDDVLGVEVIPANWLKSSSDTTQGIPPEYVSAVVEYREIDEAINGNELMLVIVLDVSALLNEERLIIHEKII